MTKQKHKNINKQTKIKNVLKKHLVGKKSLIHLNVSTMEMLIHLN